MKNTEKERPIIKEQLLKEDRFIEYCNFDAYRKRKLGTLINSEFLRAAENEGLLLPLLKQSETATKQDGKEEERTINYYSPFQIFMIAILSRNVVDSGHLRSPDSLGWQKQEGHHFISWGETSAFNARLAKDRKETDHFTFYKTFHSFLLFIHSIEQTRDYDYIKQERQRYFSSEYPHFNFDFRPINKKLASVLKTYKLNIKKLSEIRTAIGYYANEIDPLGHWFYYLEKHPQWRKDQLKGVAILAQDLYRLCDLIADIAENITGEKQKSLLDIIHPDIKPFRMENIEYASGTDFDAIKSSLEQAKKWLNNKKNKKLVDDTFEMLPESEKLKARYNLNKLIISEKELDDFEKRYGRKYYKNGTREFIVEENIKLSDLDLHTKRTAESLISQHKNVKIDKSGKQHFITSYDEISDQLESGKITFDEAIKKDNELEEKSSITTAIEFRLRDIQRNIWSAIHTIPEIFFRERERLRREREEENEKLWRKFYSENPPHQEIRADGKTRYTQPYQERIKSFIETELKKKLAKIDTQTELLKNKELELGKIAEYSHLILCLKCRKEPVQLHYGQHDRQVVDEPICDNCLKDSEIKNTTISSWKCDFCGTLIYRFANQNKLSNLLHGGRDSSISLEYGRMKIEIRCKECKQKNTRYLDWGWKP